MSLSGAMTRIERPMGAPGMLLYRHPEDRVPVGARVHVLGDECAVVASHGKAIGVLGPGQHVLSPEHHRFLEPVVDIVSGGDTLACEVYLIATGTFSGVEVQGSLGQLKDDAGKDLPLWFTASLTVSAQDPEKLVQALDSRRDDPMEAVKFVAVRALRGVVERLSKRGDIVPATISREEGKVKRAAEEDGLGLDEVGVSLIGIDQLDLMRQAPMAPGAHPSQGQPYPSQGQPYPSQGQPYPSQGQPYPGQPYPSQGQPYPGQPHPPQGQPYPSPAHPHAPQPGQPYPAPHSPYPPPGGAGPHPGQPMMGGAAVAAAAIPGAGMPPAGMPGGMPGAAELGWGIPGVPHLDASGLQCHVNFVGAFVGTPVPPHQVQWVIDTIGETLFGIARHFSGSVLDIPHHAPQLAGMLNEQAVPHLAQAGLQGHIVIHQVELPPNDPGVAELLRRGGMQ